MANSPLLKESLSITSVNAIAEAIQQVYPQFKAAAFKETACQDLHKLELKQRVAHIIHALQKYLPESFAQQAMLLIDLAQQLKSSDHHSITGFTAWPLIDLVSINGIKDPGIALPTLKELTPLFSAEFAIRPFLLEYQDFTLTEIKPWLSDPDEHVRRLVSEGTRPRLPWGQQLKPFIRDPQVILPLLTALNRDDSIYVRRSVANNLNDISKDHPDIVIKTCKSWQQKNRHPDTDWIIKHGTRSLVKKGQPDVFPLLGFTHNPKVKVSKLALEKATVTLGQSLNFSFEIVSKSKREQRFVIDYAIYHQKANGQPSAKVFKLKNITLPAKASARIEKQHPFKKITTRKYYSGQHKLAIMVNGIAVAEKDFYLQV